MLQNAGRRVISIFRSFQKGSSYVSLSQGVRPLQVPSARTLTDDVKDSPERQLFDTSLLEFLVCPLSKKPLRYEEKTNELINDELGIAYPILDGIPNMIPQDARLIRKDVGKKEEPTEA
ncbi:protein preY, mitochondrial-like [Megalops cyprinoides]|uniref:protein preY, mitochondrial-like n=1 Tax=Megalops cyprinoides TaxID=118141 RepID=UPI001863CA54|nr:protein preY, mitochondrial-like [Megalops cyprinoides]